MTIENFDISPHDNALLIQHYELLYNQTIADLEAESKQIAVFLKDTAMQPLTALHMNLSLVLSQPQPEETHQAQLSESLDVIVDLVEGMTKLVGALRPVELDTIGLDGALQQACEEFSQLTLIPVSYEGVDLPPLPEAKTIAFYRLTQEAFNILKHAQATEIYVRLQADDHSATLSIQENGNSFTLPEPTSHVRDAPDLTLFGLMLRFKHLNGTLSIESGNGQGTSITAVLPYP